MSVRLGMAALSLLVASFVSQASEEFQPLVVSDNPGELTFSYYTPSSSPSGVVVLLHGCAQNGEKFAMQSGFVVQAKQQNFALLMPQQSQSNNIQQCFNWFSSQDNQKDQGETLSIKSSIDAVLNELKTEEVYIVGLSAGGAMASGMMSHYPEKFKAGAVIAGVPYPCADNLVKAIACMKSGPADKPELLAKRIKRSNEALPKLVVITGDSDPIVAPKNSEFLAKQWVALNGLDQNSGHSTKQNAVEYIHWPSSENSVVELIRIKELGHGIPVNPTITGGGVEAPFYLNSTFSAAEYLASAWF